ncbi:14656_t:CDS:2 [Funneliformis geosporum]|nr:14656_t:CDS:2 [Funneliformis geosporum]
MSKPIFCHKNDGPSFEEYEWGNGRSGRIDRSGKVVRTDDVAARVRLWSKNIDEYLRKKALLGTNHANILKSGV